MENRIVPDAVGEYGASGPTGDSHVQFPQFRLGRHIESGPYKMIKWSTDAIRPELRLDYWVGVICEAFLEMDCNSRARESFEGRVTRVAVGELGFHQVCAQTQDVFRTRQGIARSNHHPYYLITQRECGWHLQQDGKQLQLRSGDLVLVDAARCYELHFPERFEVMSIQLPRHFVGRWLAHAESQGARYIPRDKGWGVPLSALCLQLASDPGIANHYPSELLSDHLGAMLSAALEPELQPIRLASDEFVERACGWLREHLADHGLVATVAAQALGVSVRTLHRAFAARRFTFAGALRAVRIEEAKHLLAQPRLAHIAVGEIGRRCGFADPSHFVREFRAATGLTPVRWRKHAHSDGSNSTLCRQS
jgi:AraC-like DNA-binding protein